MISIRLVFAALIAAAFSCFCANAGQPAPRPAQNQIESQAAAAPSEDASIDGALCQIVYQVDHDPTPLGYRYLFYGNGFFINRDGYVLTAAHVLSELKGGQPYLLLRGNSGPPRFVEADVVAVDGDHDVAILHATPNPFSNDADLSFLSLAGGTLRQGQTVVAEALRPTTPRYSYTGEPIIEQRSTGAVVDFEFSQLENAGADTELFVFSHPVQPGQSGAAVISAESHAVVGLVEGEWMRGALTALAAAKHGGASDDSESLSDAIAERSASPIPGAVVPIHYAISLLEQKGIAWHAVGGESNGSAMRATDASGGAASSAPVPISLVPAPFPSQSFFGGEVLLDALVDRTGTVSDVRVIHGEDPFLEKALAAVQTWMFAPARAAGQPTERRIAIAFEFPDPYVPARGDRVNHYDDAASGSTDDSAALPLATIEPLYPAADPGGGNAIIYGAVDREGQLSGLQVVRGNDGLSEAALAAVHDWKFAPAKEHGNAVDSAAVVVVNYRQPLVIRPKH